MDDIGTSGPFYLIFVSWQLCTEQERSTVHFIVNFCAVISPKQNSMSQIYESKQTFPT